MIACLWAIVCSYCWLTLWCGRHIRTWRPDRVRSTTGSCIQISRNREYSTVHHPLSNRFLKVAQSVGIQDLFFPFIIGATHVFFAMRDTLKTNLSVSMSQPAKTPKRLYTSRTREWSPLGALGVFFSSSPSQHLSHQGGPWICTSSSYFSTTVLSLPFYNIPLQTCICGQRGRRQHNNARAQLSYFD